MYPLPRLSGWFARLCAPLAHKRVNHRTLLAETINVAFLNGALTLTAVDDLTQAGVVGLKNDNVIVLTSSAPGVVTLSGAGETFALAGVGPFNGVTSIKLDLKEGNDQVTLSAINMSGAVTILGGEGDTSVAGAGADQVDIEQLNLGTETRLEKSFTVNGGAGADVINIGRDSDPHDFARFFDAVTINGGRGSIACTSGISLQTD